MLDPVVMTCAHIFDRISINEWFRTSPNSNCPLCRADVVILKSALELKGQIVKFVHENPHLCEGKDYEQLVREQETQLQDIGTPILSEAFWGSDEEANGQVLQVVLEALTHPELRMEESTGCCLQ